jgi:nicotinamidase-related amidase
MHAAMVKRTEPYIRLRTADETVARWLSRLRSRTRRRDHLVLVPSRCALLIVDMLRYFASPEGRAFLPAAAVAVARTARLLGLWRGLGGVVVFTRHCHRGPHDLGMLGRFYSDYIRCGEPDSEIVSDLSPLAGEAVLRKTTYDAFHGTGLDGRLRRQGIGQVLVTGVLTHLCCETSARSAFVRGYEVFVAADAVASSDEELHLAALLVLADGVGTVLSTREIEEQCARPA